MRALGHASYLFVFRLQLLVSLIHLPLKVVPRSPNLLQNRLILFSKVLLLREYRANLLYVALPLRVDMLDPVAELLVLLRQPKDELVFVSNRAFLLLDAAGQPFNLLFTTGCLLFYLFLG